MVDEKKESAHIKKLLEKYKAAAPAGKKFFGVGPHCTKHGNISNFGFPLTYTTQTKDKDGNVVTKSQAEWLCLACLTDYWKSLSEKGEVGTVSMAPIYLTEEEAKELQAKAEEAKAEEAKAEEAKAEEAKADIKEEK